MVTYHHICYLVKMKKSNTSSLQPNKGFTLVELLIVIAIVTIVAGLSVPFIQSFQTSTDLYTHAVTINRNLRRAQQQAIAGQNASAWGVYFDTAGNDITLYQGTDYLSRNQDYDFVTSFPPRFFLSNDFTDDINFAAYSGRPNSIGTATIASQNNESFTISVNNAGVIQIDE